VTPLARTERVEEVARMLSADRITPASRRHAEELVAAAARAKR
jgi:DNA repair ATPase RecN